MSQYVVRPVRESDIESIIAIDAQITGRGGSDRSGFWRGLLSLPFIPAGEEAAASHAGAPAPPHPLCLVGQRGEGSLAKVVGFIVGDVQSWQFGLPRHGRIVTIGVLPEHRREGLASLLAESLLRVFDRMELPFVHCLVRPGDPIEGFFESLGFRAPGFSILERPLRRSSADPR